jgi:rubredoxin
MQGEAAAPEPSTTAQDPAAGVETTGTEGPCTEPIAADRGSEASEVEPAEAEATPEDISSHRFECRSCGYVYDPGEGVRKLGIEPGTPFLELDPVGFRCPVCRSRVGAFRDIGPRSKPSGFEENLDFGLGVNRLTPGQKNVLIFGGFALAIAFFLSLYSLR